MTSRERVKRTAWFKGGDRIPYDLPEKWGSDFYWAAGKDIPFPDSRPVRGTDAWGAVWGNIGKSMLGEVKEVPLKDWADFSALRIPDIHDPSWWAHLPKVREKAGDRFVIAMGISIYERVHFIRGLENTWMDIVEHRNELEQLIDILVDMNLVAIEHYARAGVDGIIATDDWGLQQGLMISPDHWRQIWKPRYARIFKAAKSAGLVTFMHSCGDIVDIIDDLIESGLDVIQMDQQQNMGLEHLGRRFAGRIAFFCPADIQNVMITGSLEDIRRYCRDMFSHLATRHGGLIPRWYSDPAGVGHRPEAIEAMCDEFVRIAGEFYTSSNA